MQIHVIWCQSPGHSVTFPSFLLSQVDSIYPELAELLLVVLRMLLPKSCEFTVDQGILCVHVHIILYTIHVCSRYTSLILVLEN